VLVRALGLKDYDAAWRLQHQLVAARLKGEGQDTLLLLEHPPVYTCGASSKAVAPAPLPHPYRIIERGGDFTYHGPGQLVGYPILRLADSGLNARTYLRALEAVLIEAVRPFGLEAEALKGFTGVWCRGKKIASIGVAVKNGVSYHGFALNVSCDLEPFRAIYPCNLEPGQIGNLDGLLGRRLDFQSVQQGIAQAFLAYFAPSGQPAL